MSQDLLPGVTGVLALADGTILQGVGCGAVGDAVGEVCFNTAMTGYQEILTDPSYMAQIVAFTFPHVGNVGTNVEDIEQMAGGAETAARGAIFRDAPTDQANWRANSDFDGWMKRRNMIGLAGVDTRALTRKIRETGMPHGVIAHSPDRQVRPRRPGRQGQGLGRPGRPGPGQGRLDHPDLHLGRGPVVVAGRLRQAGHRRLRARTSYRGGTNKFSSDFKIEYASKFC